MTTIDKNRTAAGIMESIERGLDRMFSDHSKGIRSLRLQLEADQKDQLHRVEERKQETLETLTLAARYLRSQSNS